VKRNHLLPVMAWNFIGIYSDILHHSSSEPITMMQPIWNWERDDLAFPRPTQN
jgi:hypothetical protein